jgi:hypothetical protein
MTESRSHSGALFTYSEARTGPLWVVRLFDGSEDPDLVAAWANYLISWDGRFGVEWYGPAQVSRQFGLCPTVPFPPMHYLNSNLSNRVGIDPAQRATIDAAYQFFFRRYLEYASFISQLTLFPETTELYRQWWSSYATIYFFQPLYQVFGLLLILRADPSRRYTILAAPPSRGMLALPSPVRLASVGLFEYLHLLSSPTPFYIIL